MVLKGKLASSSAAGDNNNKSSSSSSSSGSKKDLKRSSTISTIPKHHDHDHDQFRRRPKRTCSSNSTSTISSGVKNTGPICKSRKKAAATTTTTTEVSASRPKLKPIKLKIDVDFDKQFDKQGEEDEVFWLSSGSISPLYKFYDDFSKLISPWDLLHFDERLICDPVSNPASIKGGGRVGGGLSGLGSGPSSTLGNAIFSFFDGSRVDPLEEASLALHEEAFDGGSMTEDDTCSSSFLSGGSDEAACVISDVPLIDLDREEDTDMWILSSGMETSDLDDDFPSPTFNESNHGARAAAAAVSNGGRCYESSDHNNDTSSSSIRSSKHGRAAGSVSIRIHLNSNAKKKNANPFRRRNVVVSSSLSASKLIEFKRGHHKNNAAGSPRTTAKRPLRFGRKSAQHHFLPPILENDVQVLLLNEESVPSSLDVFLRSRHHKADDDHVVTSSPMQNTSTALTCYNTDYSPFWDFNRTGMWVSLINLDGEDSKWISSSSAWDDHDLEESNIPSPTQKNILGSEPNSSELLSGTTEWDSMDCDDDEPLFWPLDKSTASDWRLALDYFCLSPRKAGSDRNNIKFGSSSSSSASEDANADSDINTSGSVRFRLHHQRRLNIKSEGSKRRQLVLVSSLTASKMVEFKRGRARKNNVVASKSKIKALSSSIDDSSATISCGFQYLKLWTIGGKERSMIARDPTGRGQMLLEDDDLCFKDQQLSIESVVGLDEFDGHEGMGNMEFNNINDFSVLRYLGE